MDEVSDMVDAELVGGSKREKRNIIQRNKKPVKTKQGPLLTMSTVATNTLRTRRTPQQQPQTQPQTQSRRSSQTQLKQASVRAMVTRSILPQNRNRDIVPHAPQDIPSRIPMSLDAMSRIFGPRNMNRRSDVPIVKQHEIRSQAQSQQHELGTDVPDHTHEIRAEIPGQSHEIRAEIPGQSHEIRPEEAVRSQETRSSVLKRMSTTSKEIPVMDTKEVDIPLSSIDVKKLTPQERSLLNSFENKTSPALGKSSGTSGGGGAKGKVRKISRENFNFVSVNFCRFFGLNL